MKRIALVVVIALIGGVPALRAIATPEPIDGMHHFIGALHEHSAYSDGFPGSTPRDYYASANAFGLDFLSGSEHSDNAELPVALSGECEDPQFYECGPVDPNSHEIRTDYTRKWDATAEQASAATTEDFTALRGFEWSSERFGHINVYFSKNYTNAYRDGGLLSMETFWDWLARSAELGGGSDGLITFNHPGDKSLMSLLPSQARQPAGTDPGFNWNDFEYRPLLDARVVGIELFNGTKDFQAGGKSYYSRALDKGWHVGAVGAEDKGHDSTDGDHLPDPNGITDDWGGAKWSKTVFIATDKTEAGLKEAMLARRMYAVLDNTLRMDMTALGHPMGSRITRPEGATAPIEVNVWNEAMTNGATAQALGSVEFVSNSGEIVAISPITDSEAPDLHYDATFGGSDRYYFARILRAGDNKPIAYSSPIWLQPSQTTGGEWLAGDLHIHTTYSHDSYGGPMDDNTGPELVYTFGHSVTSQFAVASSRGLDYLAITDHNDIRSQTDQGFTTARELGVVPIQAYESSLQGHAQYLGVDQCYSSTGPYPGVDCSAHGDTSAAGINLTAALIRADGGVFQLNHPYDDASDEVASSWKYGMDVIPDTLEVWNIPLQYEPPFPAGSNHTANLHYWERFLDAGYHIGVTGGSDNHYVSTTPAQGAGQPTTWVFAAARTQRAILEGLRAGHTFVSHEPPNLGGPQLFLEADADGDGVFESMMGDTVAPDATFRARVVGGTGSILQAFTNNGEQAGQDAVVAGPDFIVPVTPTPNSTWIRVQIGEPDGRAQRKQACDAVVGTETTYCRNRLATLAMTSAIYLSHPIPGTSGATDLI